MGTIIWLLRYSSFHPGFHKLWRTYFRMWVHYCTVQLFFLLYLGLHVKLSLFFEIPHSIMSTTCSYHTKGIYSFAILTLGHHYHLWTLKSHFISKSRNQKAGRKDKIWKIFHAYNVLLVAAAAMKTHHLINQLV